MATSLSVCRTGSACAKGLFPRLMIPDSSLSLIIQRCTTKQDRGLHQFVLIFHVPRAVLSVLDFHIDRLLLFCRRRNLVLRSLVVLERREDANSCSGAERFRQKCSTLIPSRSVRRVMMQTDLSLLLSFSA